MISVLGKMDGKTVIVTGCTGGIGKETVRELAKRGARVIMACRNMDAANAVRDEIIAETNNQDIVVKKLDLCCFESIRKFSSDINTTEQRLDVLINNAGYFGFFRRRIDDDGTEVTMKTNHYGPFLLTNLLLQLLQRTSPSKIINLSSMAHSLAIFNLTNPNPTKVWPFYLYLHSKLCNIWFTKELSRRLEGTGVVVYAVHPGFVDTELWRYVPIPFNYAFNLIKRIFFFTPQEGSETTVFLACDDSFSCSGEYFFRCKLISSSAKSNSVTKAKWLWEVSEKIVELECTGDGENISIIHV